MIKQDLYNWKLQYLNFPRIPLSKQWMKEPPNTPEQLIVHKLILNQTIDVREQNILSEALHFYRRIIPRLKKGDFKQLITELNEFKAYFWYAFNNYPLVQGEIYANHIVRLVKNKSVLKRRDRIFQESYLTCPSRELVKEINEYNRANTPDFNVFYGSSSIDAVLNEVRPSSGELVTAGIWKRENTRPLLVYPVHLALNCF